MTVVANSPRIFDLVDENLEIEQIASGRTFTEGPVWNAAGGFLLFSDIPESKRCKWTAAGGTEVVMDPSNMCNGMTYDAQGNLLVCEHVTSTVVRERPDGTRETIASHYLGKELNSPNDIIVGKDGSIYFTDPPYGRMAGFGVEREQDMALQGVFQIRAASGELELLIDDFDGPNGLCFSPGEKLLYINDTTRAHIRVFDVQGDGSIANGRLFAEGIGEGPPGPVVDGMKCDEQGNVWVTGPGGIWVFSPDGEHLGVVETPESVGNLTWGGPNWRTMFVPACTSVYRFETKVAGHREPYMA